LKELHERKVLGNQDLRREGKTWRRMNPRRGTTEEKANTRLDGTYLHLGQSLEVEEAKSGLHLRMRSGWCSNGMEVDSF